MQPSRTIRCAIYTRKSTEEGLEQDYNSLHAQRDACAAYVMSQAGEGWTLLPEIYDDGGYSGGNLDRPALRRLMDDIEAKKVDVVVVYKVDRLTRSLADFSKIVDVLDRTGSSFVSVTQAFNTTTPMGRLTLNVLLSFAQFEREVTSHGKLRLAQLERDGDTPLLRLPLRFNRGGGIAMVGPGGGPAITRQSIDPALSSALVRAEAWKRRMIGGEGATLETIADEEKLNQSYASRMLRVAFLAPDLKQADLDGTAPEALSLYAIMHRGLPLDWDEQRAMFAT